MPILAQASGKGESAPNPIEIFAQQSGVGVGAALFLVGAGIIIQVLAYWVAAKVVIANEYSTLFRAAQLWLLTVLVSMGLGIVVAALAFGMVMAFRDAPPAMWWVLFGGLVLLSIVVGLQLPAKIFRTSILRSFGVLVLASILTVAGQTALHQALGNSPLTPFRPLLAILSDSNEGRQRRLREVTRGDPLVNIEVRLDQLSSPEERQRSFTERQAELRAVFATLEQRRKTLKATDKIETADYEAVRKRYEDLVQLMRADYSASQTPLPPR